MPTVISISSIRGGVGKSSLSLELSLGFSTKGKVLLIDTDFYAPTLFNEINARLKGRELRPRNFSRDVLRGLCEVQTAVMKVASNFYVMFSDPKVNLWELSTDIGSRDFWIEDDPKKPSKAEMGLALIKEFSKEQMFDYIIFDSMAGMAYPVIFFSYLSTYPIFLSRASLPQIEDVISFVNLIGQPEKPINLIWSNVPNVDSYLQTTREKLNQIISSRCGGRFKPLGFIPRDPQFEKNSLEGNLTTIPFAANTPYYQQLNTIINSLIS
ncbi:MAG: AAA family ATPase [Candidatus Heimdallarchaeota archaeon]|nr:AAA family ATPase [Candidatus Heimdallarchaeota archaeon]